MKIEQLSNLYYENLNANEKKVVQQLIENQALYASFSCEQLAECCHISRATLLRLLRKIGLSSFSDLKTILQNAIDTPKTNGSYDINEVHSIYHTLIDHLKQFSYDDICKALYHANIIYIYGTGNEQKTLAEEYKRIFLSAGKCVIDFYDYGEIAFIKQRMEPDDVFVFISLSGETKEALEIRNLIASTKIQTISITRLANNSLSRSCLYNLYVHTQVVESTLSSYEIVSAFYVLLDILFIHYLEYMKAGVL